MYRFKYSNLTRIIFLYIYGSQTGRTTLGQSGSESNGNEGVLASSLKMEPHNEMKFSVT